MSSLVYPARFVPGSAAPARTGIGSRVVAVDESVHGLSLHSTVHNSSMQASMQNYPGLSSAASEDQHLSYEPFVEPVTGIHTTVPIHTDPVTGIRRAVRPIPPGFMHETVLQAQNAPQSQASLLSAIFRCLTPRTQPAQPAQPSLLMQPVSPTINRRLDFSGGDGSVSVNATPESMAQLRLTLAAAAAMSPKARLSGAGGHRRLGRRVRVYHRRR
jgi:hypothetical protein